MIRPSTAHPTKTQPQTTAKEDGVGCSAKEFKIMSEIGKGAYGTVYKVLSLRDGKEYVLKKIPIQYLKKKELTDVITEAKILRKVSHHNIVKSYSHFVENSALNIIMEYAEGGDLQKVI